MTKPKVWKVVNLCMTVLSLYYSLVYENLWFYVSIRIYVKLVMKYKLKGGRDWFERSHLLD